MKASKQTIRAALHTARKTKYPKESARKVQTPTEWEAHRLQLIKTLKEALND